MDSFSIPFLTESWSWQLDGWIIVIGILSCVASAFVGSFLVLRKMSLLGDAISHAVLPGIAAAFFLTGARDSVFMFLGAIASGLLTAFLTQWISNLGKVDEGASMGVVFTTLFALGLVMIVQAADQVDLDPGCVLYGSIELSTLDTIPILGIDVPRAAVKLSVVCLINFAFVVLLYKELKLTSFDPELATTLGFRSRLLHYLLMVLVAVTTVACFESVGNILVIAMMIIPTATALLISDKLWKVLALSILIAVASAVGGHLAASLLPKMLNALETPPWTQLHSTHTAGMIAVVGGLLFLTASLIAPKQGLLIRWFRQRVLSVQILSEDILASLYKAEEKQLEAKSWGRLQRELLCNRWSLWLAAGVMRLRGKIAIQGETLLLTTAGRQAAMQLVRSHRLWEHYLVDKGAVPWERIHAQAERLEHFTTRELQAELDRESNSPQTDPHGSRIPDVGSQDEPS